MRLFVIARQELHSLLTSTLGWGLLALSLLIHALVFRSLIHDYLTLSGAESITADIVTPLLGLGAFTLLLIVPLLSMRLISGERRHHTLALLLAAPVGSGEIVLGKFLGALSFLLLSLLLTALLPLSLLASNPIDLGRLLATLLGLLLTAAAYLAIGTAISSLMRQPSSAALTTLATLFLLWIIHWLGAAAGGLAPLIDYLSIPLHLEPFTQGLVTAYDTTFFIVATLAALRLAVLQLERIRRHG